MLTGSLNGGFSGVSRYFRHFDVPQYYLSSAMIKNSGDRLGVSAFIKLGPLGVRKICGEEIAGWVSCKQTGVAEKKVIIRRGTPGRSSFNRFMNVNFLKLDLLAGGIWAWEKNRWYYGLARQCHLGGWLR